jgi:Uroporphyrinogen-III synthase HemD
MEGLITFNGVDGAAICGPALSSATPLRQSLREVQDEQTTGAPHEIKIMADRLNGYRILILETREEAQFSRLLTEQGADVLQCPMFAIHDAPDAAPVEAWIRRFIEKPCDDLVLMTGEGLRRLIKVARRIDLEQKFIAALGRARKFARGPKPGRALREIGLEPQVTTEKPTSEGISEMLTRVDLRGHRVGLQLYPDRDHRSPTPTSLLRSTRWRRAASMPLR